MWHKRRLLCPRRSCGASGALGTRGAGCVSCTIGSLLSYDRRGDGTVGSPAWLVTRERSDGRGRQEGVVIGTSAGYTIVLCYRYGLYPSLSDPEPYFAPD